jgi:hypothetical protein
VRGMFKRWLYCARDFYRATLVLCLALAAMAADCKHGDPTPTLIIPIAGSSPIAALSVSPDGHLLAGSELNGTITVWDVASRSQLGRYASPGGLIHSRVVVLDDGTLLFSSDSRQIVRTVQSHDVALESDKLGQGLLTFALVQEGLGLNKADLDGDGLVTLDEWLRYGEMRVPSLYRNVRDGKVHPARRGEILTAKELQTDLQVAQTPELYDFHRDTGVVAFRSTGANAANSRAGLPASPR